LYRARHRPSPRSPPNTPTSIGLRIAGQSWRSSGRARLIEFDISQRPVDVLEVISRTIRNRGVGVYIWNVAQATQLVAALETPCGRTSS